jgi:hypothetical protein
MLKRKLAALSDRKRLGPGYLQCTPCFSVENILCRKHTAPIKNPPPPPHSPHILTRYRELLNSVYTKIINGYSLFYKIEINLLSKFLIFSTGFPVRTLHSGHLGFVSELEENPFEVGRTVDMNADCATCTCAPRMDGAILLELAELLGLESGLL